MMTDPIADMLTRIRNGSQVHKKEVSVPFSKIKKAIADILVNAGYLAKAEAVKDQPFITLTLKYTDDVPAITHIKRVSTPGQRRYVKAAEISKVLNGLGISILSTPQGVLTNSEARAKKVGGELLCELY